MALYPAVSSTAVPIISKVEIFVASAEFFISD